MTTVKEMREYLATIPDNLMVLATWEGVYAHIGMDAVQEEVRVNNQKTPCLVFNVEYDQV